MFSKIFFIICLIFGGYLVFPSSNSKIIFWEYNKNITLEKFNSFNLKDAYCNISVIFEIPLNEFDLYFWDEQILRMNKLTYRENKYSEKFYFIEKDKEYGALFFSIVIDNVIVLNGLNRVMILDAEPLPYDDMGFPCFSVWAGNNNYIYFRLSYSPILTRMSIYDMPSELGNLKQLYVKEIFNFFKNIGKTKEEKINILDFSKKEKLDIFPLFYH